MKLTHCYPWENLRTRDERKHIMREFADAGSTSIVLSDAMLCNACGDLSSILSFQTDMKEFGLEFVDAHAPWGTWADPGMPWESWHENIVLRHRMAIGICHQCGVHTLAFHTGNTLNNVFGEKLVLEDYYAMLIRSLEELLPYAERDQVILALENQWTPLNHTDELLKVMRHFNSPYLGLCCDTGHANVTEKGAACPEKSCVPPIWNILGVPVKWEQNVIEKMAPWLVNCHLHDNDGLADQHVLPGEGNVDWPRIKAALRSAPRLQSIQNEATFPQDRPLGEVCRFLQDFFQDVTSNR